MSDSADVPVLLDEFESTVRDERLSDATAVLNDVLAAVRDRSAADAAVSNRAAAALNVLDQDDDRRDTVDEFVMHSSGLDGARAGFVMSASSALLGPDEVGFDDLIEHTQSLATYEREFRDLRGPIEDVLADVSVPPHIAILETETRRDVNAVAAPFVLETTVGNVGDEPAADVEVGLDLPDGLSGAREAVAVGRLGPELNERVDFELRADAADTYSAEIRGASSNAGERLAQTRVEVVDRGTLLQRILQRIIQLNEFVADNVSHGGRRNALSANLDTARSRVERAIEFYSNDRYRQTDNMLNAASKNLGALLNKLDAATGTGKGGAGKGRKRRVDDQTAFLIRSDATDIVDLIAYARDTLV